MLNRTFISGNIFDSKCEALVNTTNCKGAMGAGLAFAYRLLYPEMYAQYKDLCTNGKISIGTLWGYKTNNKINPKLILNFPTKDNWKDDSKYEYIEKGLNTFAEQYESYGISSIAFPLLGTLNGHLAESDVFTIMCDLLSDCNIQIEIYKYDSNKPDRLYEKFKAWTLSLSSDRISSIIGEEQAAIVLQLFNDFGYSHLIEIPMYPNICRHSIELLYQDMIQSSEN